jgi:thioesterase domain-containing protein
MADATAAKRERLKQLLRRKQEPAPVRPPSIVALHELWKRTARPYNASPSAFLVQMSDGPGRPFFCAPAAAGVTSCYQAVARHFEGVRPFYGLLAPGLDGGQEPHWRVRDLAASFSWAVRSVQPSGPYAIGGWCMGGRTAFELARELVLQGEKVEPLIILDSAAAPVGPEGKIFLELDGLTRCLPSVIWMLASIAGRKVQFGPEDLEGREPAEQIEITVRTAREATLFSPDFTDVDAARLMIVSYMGLTAYAAFEPAAIDLAVTVFIAEKTRNSGSANNPFLPALGWVPYTSHADEISVPGNHFSMMSPPHADVVAKNLLEVLASACA